MAPSRTTTVKSKHAANKSGIRNSKYSGKPQGDGVSKARKPLKSKAPPLKSSGGPVQKKKRRIYTEKELGVPTLNMTTPVGVEKPKGKKKGKVFVDDQVRLVPTQHQPNSKCPEQTNQLEQESMMTILAMVNADKEGQIESKMMKARQMEEIREARKAEAEKRVEMRKSKLDEAKDSIRKKRKRLGTGGGAGEELESINKEAAAGTKPLKVKKKRVSFA